MSGLVLDASAAIALLREEPGADDVRHHLAEARGAGDSIVVPTLFWPEIVNVLAMRHRWSPAGIVEAVYELEQIGVSTADLGRPGTLAVIDTVGRTGLTAYDAVYLVLAESSDARLLTADEALAEAAGDCAIFVGPRGVAEGRAAHEPPDSWTAWRGAARYLEELRADYGSPSG